MPKREQKSSCLLTLTCYRMPVNRAHPGFIPQTVPTPCIHTLHTKVRVTGSYFSKAKNTLAYLAAKQRAALSYIG